MNRFPPEFAGIHLLYLNSKIIAARALIGILLMALVLLAAQAITYFRQINHLRFQMEEYNHIQCPDTAVSKIVENGRVTCILRMIGPGASARAVPPGWLDVPRGRKEK